MEYEIDSYMHSILGVLSNPAATQILGTLYRADREVSGSEIQETTALERREFFRAVRMLEQQRLINRSQRSSYTCTPVGKDVVEGLHGLEQQIAKSYASLWVAETKALVGEGKTWNLVKEMILSDGSNSGQQ